MTEKTTDPCERLHDFIMRVYSAGVANPALMSATHLLDTPRAVSDINRLMIRSRENRELLDAAKAVIQQWDTPNWKRMEATAAFISALRAAVAKAEGR